MPWNASRIIHGGKTGVLLTNLTYTLSEIPLFAKAGAVVPLQTMSQADGPLIWVIFPGATSGNGSNYEDDGDTTQYEQPGGPYSWSYLTHTSSKEALRVQIKVGQYGRRDQVLQLRRIPGSSPPKNVTWNGKSLPNIDPPNGGVGPSPKSGWWIAPEDEDSLWQTSGSIMVALSMSDDDSEIIDVIISL